MNGSDIGEFTFVAMDLTEKSVFEAKSHKDPRNLRERKRFPSLIIEMKLIQTALIYFNPVLPEKLSHHLTGIK